MTISRQRPTGLTSDEAKARLAHYGFNEVREMKPNVLLTLARKFWAPVPWILEATIILTLLTARYLDAAIIGFLLVFNIVMSFVLVASVPVALPATFTLALAFMLVLDRIKLLVTSRSDPPAHAQ